MNTRQIRLQTPGTAPVFQYENQEIATLQADEVLVRNHIIAIDLYRIHTTHPDATPSGAAVAVVVDSKSPGFSPGNQVVGRLPWSVYAKVPAKTLRKIYTDEFPPQYYLSLLGLPGLAAYFSVIDICRPHPGDTMYITDLAGEVGCIAGQIARLQGCRVRGAVHTEEKVQQLEKEFGFTALDYTALKAGELPRALSTLCPQGIDCCIENTAGDQTETILSLLNEYGRVALCSHMAAWPVPDTDAWERRLSPRVLTRKGILKTCTLAAYRTRYVEALAALTSWARRGDIHPFDTIVDGFDKLPEAFSDACSGKNTGKTLVRIGPSE